MAKRKSEILMQELDNLDGTIEEDVNTKQNEWMKAVSYELTLFFNKQELDDKITASPDKAIVFNLEKTADAGTINFKEQINELSNKIKNLSDDNIVIKNLLNKYKKENEDLVIKNESLNEELIKLKKTINDDEAIKMVRDNLTQKIDDTAQEQEEKINELKEKLKNNGIRTQGFEPYNNKIKIPLPKYEGTEVERPMKFLNEFEKYIALKKLEEEVTLELLHTVLQKDANEWWYIYQDDVLTYEGFKNLFLDRYWNEDVQRTTRRKVEFGQYENGKLSRMTYATQVYGFAKELNLQYSDEELAEKISKHFSRNVRQAMQFSQKRNKNTLFKILSDFDNDDKLQEKRAVNKNYSQQKNFNKNENTNKTYYNHNNNATNQNNYKQDYKKPQQNPSINLTEVEENKNKQKNQQREKLKSPVNKKQLQKSNKELEVLNIDISDESNDKNQEN